MRYGVVVVSMLLAMVVMLGTVSAAVKEQCKTCHSDMYGFLQEGKHKTHDCSLCHGDSTKQLQDHMSNPKKTKPSIKPLEEGPKFCGQCHEKYYEQYKDINWKSIAKIEKASPVGRAPAFDLLLHRYGFVFEHAEPRSHVFMLLDHVIVDRGYKGRFRLKDYSLFVPPEGWDGDITPLIVDTKKNNPYSGRADVKGLKPWVAGAGSTICLQCKTTDMVVGWETISKGGNKTGYAKFMRWGNAKTAELIAAGKIKRSLNCVHCHDPHMTKMRVIRDALIEAVKKKGPFPYDKEKNEKAKKLYKIVAFPSVKNNYREIIVWDADAKDPKLNWLTCAQCHVEYECNPVTDVKTDKKVKHEEDPRTNIFPWVNVNEVYDYYLKEVGIYTFKHGITKAKLIKAQHPEVEVWWESKHEKNNVDCIDCHMPEIDGIAFHSPRSPQDIGVDKTCLKCHKEWDVEQANYVIESIQEYSKGKMRDAEFHLSRLVDRIKLAEQIGVDPAKIEEARELHARAHILWEWWTAENSDGFHDPDEAWLTLGEASRLAEKGWKMLDEEIKKKMEELQAKIEKAPAEKVPKAEEVVPKVEKPAPEKPAEVKPPAEEKKGICGPTAIIALAMLPLAGYLALKRRR